MFDEASKATFFFDAVRRLAPRFTIVLGSGLSALVDRMQIEMQIPFSAVAALGATSVQGHHGRIVLAAWANQPILVFCGRLHRYEGHSWEKVRTPVGLAADLGVRDVILTNAAGGIRADLRPGSIMGIDAILDWTRPFPCLAGMTLASLAHCSGRALAKLSQCARELRIEFSTGSYAGLLGPNYETPTEIRALRALGADAVGMSTVRELETACERGLECVAISCITNFAAGLCDAPPSHNEVLVNSALGLERVGSLLERFIRSSVSPP